MKGTCAEARVEGEVDEFVVQQKPQGIFFTEGTEELKKFRNLLALYSLYHAKERIDKSKERLNQEGTTLKTGEMEDVGMYICLRQDWQYFPMMRTK